MDWSKQAETMVQTWTEAQKTMWEGWYDMLQGASNSGGTPFSLYPGMMKQWQQMATQGLDSWMKGADPTAKNTARQLMASQETMMRFLQSVTQGWQAIAPKVAAGEDWRSALNEYSSQWIQGMFGAPTGLMSVGKDLTDLWQFYLQEWQKLSQPWLQSWLQSPGHLGHLMMGGSSEMAQLSKFHWDVYERTFGGMTEVPGLGYNREMNAKLLRGFDAWVDLQQASAEYHTFLSKTISEAFERFMGQLVSLSEKGEKIDSIQDLMNLWFETVDQTFTHMYVSEDYLRIQKDMAGAAMMNKIRQQEIFEVVLEMLDLPTRSELDDAYRSLNDLRKEVRVLKKMVKEQGSAAAPAKKPAPQKASKAAAARKKSAAAKSNEIKPESVTSG